MLKYFASRLKKERQKRNLTYRELGKKCGLSATFLSDLEKSKKMPSLIRAIKLADFFDITVTDMFGISNTITLDTIIDTLNTDKQLYKEFCGTFVLENGETINSLIEKLKE